MKTGKHPGGRPTKFDDLTVKKLEEAFAIGCNDSQACAYSGVSRQAFYAHLKRFPEFQDRIDELRERPVLKARKTIYDNLNDPNTAKWFLERKMKAEFGSNVAPLEASFNDEAGKPLFQITLTPPKESVE